jgi:hypothetical protein
MPHALLANQGVAIGRGNAGALLAAMLKSVKAKVGKFGSFGVSKDAKYAAMIVELINIKLITWEELGGWLQLFFSSSGWMTTASRSGSRVKSNYNELNHTIYSAPFRRCPQLVSGLNCQLSVLSFQQSGTSRRVQQGLGPEPDTDKLIADSYLLTNHGKGLAGEEKSCRRTRATRRANR